MGAYNTYGVPDAGPVNPIEWEEHAVVDGVKGKKVFPVILPPTAQTNPSISLSNDDEVAVSNKTVTMTINGIPYQKILNFNNAGDFLSAGPWVEM